MIRSSRPMVSKLLTEMTDRGMLFARDGVTSCLPLENPAPGSSC